MHYKNATEYFKNLYKKLQIDPPDFHIVLGSALGGAIDGVLQSSSARAGGWKKLHEFSFNEVPDLPKTNIAGHKGSFIIFQNGKRTVMFQCGRIHGYEGHPPRLAVLPVMASRLAGTKNFILTNAAGTLRVDLPPGTAMVIKDHVNMTGQNPLVGENPMDHNGKDLGPRFPDMSAVYDKEFRKRLLSSMEKAHMPAKEGVYMGLLGPTYETPAEVQLFVRWGLDAVGMSTVWEAISLRHSGANVGGVSLLTNFACGLCGDEVLDHEDLLKTTKTSAEKVVSALFHFLEA